MRKFFARALVAGIGALGFAGSAAAVAITPPTAQLVIDGDRDNATAIPVSENSDGTFFIENWQSSTAEYSISLNAGFDPDPDIVYAGSVIDFGAPTSFGFIFSQGIVATATPGSVFHTHSSSTTVGSGGSTPVSALAPPLGIPVDGDAIPEIAVFTVSINGGASYLNAGLDLSPSFVGASPSDNQGPFTEGFIAGPAGAGIYDAMRVDVNFGMAGGSDAYTFNGKASVIPEPHTAALLAFGLCGVAAVTRRRR
ncbi:MAG: PEP-CTERM sorting domain-containing protein [Deltaproteobacteria bacterium]|nr:PEP-CTERM sorting domain-containing protein [Deltaproteobacteria bacterium]MBW2362649.1 PEP-CTERM sorting domain-containing protein [Deltaproteobacteria bacterium]